MKKLAIFDFDGTLFDTVDDVVICFNRALEVNNFPTLTKDEYIHILGGNINQSVSLMLKDKNTQENIEIIINEYEKLYKKSPKNNTHPFPDVYEVLKDLQEKGVLLAINSNRKTESIEYYVNEFFKDIDFKMIKGHDFSNPSKPMPCGVKKIMYKLKVPKEETVFIGDSITDIKTAKNGEIDCVLVSWGYGEKDAFESDYPIKIIDDMHELFNII